MLGILAGGKRCMRTAVCPGEAGSVGDPIGAADAQAAAAERQATMCRHRRGLLRHSRPRNDEAGGEPPAWVTREGPALLEQALEAACTD